MNTTDEISTQPSNPTWFGWRKARGERRWTLVVAAVDEDAAWQILFMDKGFAGETRVLPLGRDPNTEKKR